MTKVRRFIYTRPNRSDCCMHIKFGNTSEGPVACGRQAAPGWLWVKSMNWTGLPRLCTQCSQAVALF